MTVLRHISQVRGEQVPSQRPLWLKVHPLAQEGVPPGKGTTGLAPVEILSPAPFSGTLEF